jgi:hypothetical protein
MTQVQTFPRGLFTERTDGHLSTKASVLGWTQGTCAKEFFIDRERFTLLATMRPDGGSITQWVYRSPQRDCRVING